MKTQTLADVFTPEMYEALKQAWLDAANDVGYDLVRKAFIGNQRQGIELLKNEHTN